MRKGKKLSGRGKHSYKEGKKWPSRRLETVMRNDGNSHQEGMEKTAIRKGKNSQKEGKTQPRERGKTSHKEGEKQPSGRMETAVRKGENSQKEGKKTSYKEGWEQHQPLSLWSSSRSPSANTPMGAHPRVFKAGTGEDSL